MSLKTGSISFFEMSGKVSCSLQLKLFIVYDLVLEKSSSCLQPGRKKN